ncbi:uncharacterized protein LOC62_04G006489 [Vanrija pseudolonga]|uniref:Methyltransferase type 11 domain-containing protein n=1 Tax=Vanrija pseudolonga TaxID=143232 RepID=A0AAF1BNC9_9TREE|nr:hypothetical protein LOC62_04G006489 [Vanrija pseudolonga]
MAASEEHWDGEAYKERPGTREMAKVNGETNVPKALAAAGIDPKSFKSLHLLEVGAGVGTVTPYLADMFASVHALEPSPSMLAQLAKEPVATRDNVTYSQHPVTPSTGAEFATPLLSPTPADHERKLVPPRAQFDVAICTLVVHHVDDFAPFFAGVLSLLKPGGLFVAIEFRKDDDGHDLSKQYHLEVAPELTPVSDDDFKFPNDNHFRTAYSHESLGALFKKNGYVDVGATDVDSCQAFGYDGRKAVPAIAAWGRKPE